MNPILTIEVLSPARELYGRRDTFEQYHNLPSLREYVLISQESPRVESFFKEDPKHWFHSVYTQLEDQLVLRSLEKNISLQDIYQRVFPS